MSIHTSASPKTVRAIFGQAQTHCQVDENSINLYLKIPTFGGEQKECLLSESGNLYEKLGFQVLETENALVGARIETAQFPLERQTNKIYLDFLKLTQDWDLFRVWHYVPYINEDTDSLENYRSFCKGRSLGFEDFYGENFEVKLPAASAVGINDDKLVIYFIAGKKGGNQRETYEHIENYEQIPAFKYPQQYGPRSPSFARGTLIAQDGQQIGYVSGTASIKGHKSVTLEDVAQQLHTTIDNMSIVCERMGLVERMSYCGPMPDPAKYERHFKVYIRHEADAQYIQEEFPKILFATEDDRIIYLRSDICRSDLDLEIEAVIEERRSSPMHLPIQERQSQTLDALLQKTVETHGDKTAIVYDRDRLTYRDLFNRVVALSRGLRSLGTRQSDCIMFVLPNCPEFAISFYAAARLGAIALPLNPMFKASEIQYYANDSNATTIITDSARAPLCQQAIERLGHNINLIVIGDKPSIGTSFNRLITENSAFLESDEIVPYEGDVLYQYSSGSTGRPKKLSRTQKNIYHQALNCTATMQVTAEDSILAIVPLFHAYGFGECMLAAMTTGATLVILEPVLQDGKPVEMPLLFRRGRIIELIESQKVTVLPIVPYIASILAATPQDARVNLSALRLCLCAGNFLSQDIFDKFRQRFGVSLRQLYGCTEAGAVCVNMEAESNLQYNTIGLPMQNVEIAIVDEEGKDCASDVIGEIVIKSQTLTRGYSDRPDLNKEAFSGGCFFTGDLGKKDDRGRIYITGRKKLFIDAGGQKVDPLEVEDILIGHPQVQEVVVVGAKGADDIELIKAVIVPKGEGNSQQLTTYCKERLADFKVPRSIEFRQALPKNELGKVLRSKI